MDMKIGLIKSFTTDADMQPDTVWLLAWLDYVECCVLLCFHPAVLLCVCVCLGFLPAARSPQFLTLTLTRTTPLSSSADMVGSPLWGVPFRDALSSSRLKIESKITMDGGSRFSYSFDKYIENSVNKKRKTTSILLTSFKIKAPLQDEKKLSRIKK